MAIVPRGRAADKTWDNGASTFVWNTTDLNWTGTAWNNASFDNAVFGPTGVGAISVPAGISVQNFNFTADGYSFNGPGGFTLANAFPLIFGPNATRFDVAAGATVSMNVPITSSTTAFLKYGAGVLEMSQPLSITTTYPLTSNPALTANVIIESISGLAGTLRLANSGVLPSTTSVAIGNAYLDIGANNLTLSSLTYTNVTGNNGIPWNTALNANNGVVGSGTLRVTGDIHVIGVSGGNQGNSIAANVDFGGGTQVVRVGLFNTVGLNTALMFTGSLSNGSLLKTIGISSTGDTYSTDGISLFANNTYTGSTIINGGVSVATGTNASSLIKIAGIPIGDTVSSFSLQGANGSFLSANTIQAFAGGTFILDNNAALGANGLNQPNIPAAQNNNRIRDDAAMQLRDGNFTYRGFASAAASESFGSLDIQGGYNVVTLTPNGAGGSATVTATGSLTMAPRSTLRIGSATLGGDSKLFVNGSLPAPDATGILPNIVSDSDFLTYNGTTGFTPYTGYSTTLTPGTNVLRTSSPPTVNTVSINALKTSGSVTVTTAAGNTLTVASGMILNTGTLTFTGGTLAFESNPGVFFGGATINSAVTGSAGVIVPSGTTTFNGNLSNLNGTMTVQRGTATLNTATFTGPIEVRAGTLNYNVSQTGPGLSAITLGVAANDANLVGLVPKFNFSGAGANAVIDRPIVVDNGGLTAAGVALSASAVPQLTPLSNATGSQTLNGAITLNSPVNLYGGGGGGTGATIFNGNISGAGQMIIQDGRVVFNGQVANAGGFNIGVHSTITQVAFLGSAGGTAPVIINAGNNVGVSYNSGSLPTGPITVQSNVQPGTSTLTALQNSTISNSITLADSGFASFSGLIGSVGSGITATWAGPIAGVGTLTKAGDGTLVLNNSGNTYSGFLSINAGRLTLAGNGSLANVSGIRVGTASGPVFDVSGLTGGPSFNPTLVSGGSFALAVNQGLSGAGLVSGKLAVPSGSTMTPGYQGAGALSCDSDVTIAGRLFVQIGGPASAALFNMTGSANLTLTGSSIVAFSASSPLDGVTPVTFVQLSGGTIMGTFGTVMNLPANYSLQYNSNSIVLVPVPEPAAILGFSFLGMAAWRLRRARNKNR